MESAIKGAQEEYGELYGKSAGKLYKELTNAVGEKKAKSFIDSIKKNLKRRVQFQKDLLKLLRTCSVVMLITAIARLGCKA